MHRLNYQQFYHVAPQEARESIDRHGISHQRGYPKWEENVAGEGNFLWNNLADAHTYRAMANRATKDEEAPNWEDFSGQDYDVYEVSIPNISKIRVQDDPEFESAVYTRSPIPRRFVRRIG